MSPFGAYAGWGTRLAAYLIDALVAVGAGLVFIIIGAILLGTDASVLGVLIMVLGYARDPRRVTIWNFVMKQGTTGQSIGKGVMGIKVVGENTGAPARHRRRFRPLADAHVRRRCDLLPRLPVAAVGRQEADLGRQGRRPAWCCRRPRPDPTAR